MPFLLNDAALQSAEITVERLGVWEGRATVAGQLDLADGAAVTLVLGDQTFVGHVVTGGTFPGGMESTYELAGGGTGWAQEVLAKGYQDPAGIALSVVAAELAAAAGEKLDVGGSTVILGDHWQRPSGPASVALSALFPLEAGGWRVDPDGITRPGPRPPAPLPASVHLVVEDQRRSERWARLGLPDDAVSAVLPGAVLAAENLAAPIVVATTTIRACSKSVTVEVRGEGGLVELLVALVQAFTPSRIFGGLWTYQVGDADTGRPNLRALARVPGLPDTLACDKVPGVAGVTSTLAPGALVLVAFRDGSPARPCVVGHLPGGPAPLAVGLDGGAVTVGGAAGTGAPLALAAPLQTWALAVDAAFASLTPPVSVPALNPSMATTKAKGV